MAIDIEVVRGRDIAGIIPALGRLRAEVFRDYPYLYDGDPTYEEAYLQTYANSARAAIVVARDGAEVVGCSSCLPLADETADVQAPFVARGIGVERVFYFGESVLRRGLRGQGVGVAFFREREAHASSVSDCDFAAFCSVVRPPNHPRRPADFVPLDSFWKKRGFTPRPDLVCHMRWREIGQAFEVDHALMVWMKSLREAPLP